MRWFVSLLVLLAGVASAADTQTFTDDLGRTVTVPLHPQRIVSLHDLDITIPLIELGVPPREDASGRQPLFTRQRTADRR